jgi:Zn-dependent protease
VLNFDLGLIALQYFCLLFSLCVHEAAHAAMAEYRGDSTARFLGRITLDPRKHIDPLGTVVLPLLGIVTNIPFLFGWAKPVPFNPNNLKDRAKDPVWIALAGPGSNLVLALFCALVLRVLIMSTDYGLVPLDVAGALQTVFIQLAVINFVLILFNVLPVPPLDGHYVLKYFLPPKAEEMLDRIGPFGIIIAILVGGQWIKFAMPYCLSLVQLVATGGMD